MANGGRGWFQRRKPQTGVGEPTRAPREPEPTRIEAYEAERRAEAARRGAHEPDRPDFDSLLRPTAGHGSSAPSAPQPDVPVAPTEQIAAAPRSLAPAADDTDRRWAPPEDSWRRPDGNGSNAVVEPSDRGPTSSRTSADAPGAAQTPTHDARTNETERPRESDTSSPSPSTGRYDWDAATAAALSDESAPTAAPASTPLPHSDPDKLLEDIIREIVGDATAETVSSLHQPRPADPPSSRVPAGRPEEAEPPALGAPASRQPESDDPAGIRDGEALPLSVDRDAAGGARTDSAEAASASTEPYAVGAGSESPAELEVRGTARGEPVAHPSAATTNHAVVAGPPGSVSRETPESYGGTPLADQLADETRRRLALDQAVLPLPGTTRIFTISNQKGGVGKTTSAVNLAAALARAGAHVLVVDLDPQGNASTALGVDHRSDLQSVYEVLVSDLPIAEVVQPSTEHEHLDCVPATIHLAGAEIELVSLVAREQRLRRALDAHLATMERPYDYVFIDCPPSLGLLTINAFVAAREVLIPIQCEYYALEGLSQLLSNIELIERHLNPELRLTTILLTMYDSRTNLAQQVAQEVRDHFPTQTLDTIIPRSVRVSEAPSYGQSVISYDFASTGSLSYREAAAEIAWRGAQEASEEGAQDAPRQKESR